MTKLHIETYGEGPTTLVMCNGLSQSTANWRGIARQNPQFRWVLFDTRGHGRSELGERPYHLDGHVDDLFSVLDTKVSGRPILMGFSHGGRVAARAVSRQTDRFQGLVLISAGATVTPLRRAHVASWQNCLKLGGVEAMAWASLPNIVGIKILNKFPDLSILVRGSAARNRVEGLTAMFEAMVRYPPMEDDARKINIPVQIFHGQQDPLVRDTDIDDLCTWMPHAKRVAFPNCGHTLPLEEPEAFLSEVAAFASQVTKQKRPAGHFN